MRDSGIGKQYNSQDRYRVIIHDTTMAKLFHSGATMNIERSVLMFLLLAWQLATALVHGTGIAADNYSAATSSAVDANSGRYASTKDNGAASILTDYLKGYGVRMTDFGQHQQDSIEYQTDYGNTQARYGSSSSGSSSSEVDSDEQQSHISAGYHHPQPGTYQHSAASGKAYEVPHQSDIDKFVENNFSHQYEQESGGIGEGGGGYHSASGDEGSSADYHQSHAGFTTSQHQHTDVINYVPYPVVKKLHVPYSKPVQIPISHAVIIPVRKPVPIHIPITKQIQVPVEKELRVPVERLVPYPVEKQVPVPVEKHVPYTVVRYVPVKVSKPFAVKVPVVKTVVHKVKQWW